MKKKIMAVLFVMVMALQLVACGSKTCKAKGCDETEIFKDGYCEIHYYVEAGKELLNDLLN